MRGLLVVSCIAMVAGCGARGPAIAPTTGAPEAPREEASAGAECAFRADTGEDGWTRFTFCGPAPSWASASSGHEPSDAPSVPESLRAARARLLALGMPDVRGAELREIEIADFDVWGRSERARTRGWVLPGTSDAPRFAVTVGSVVWPVHGMGPPLDAIASCESAADVLDRAEAIDPREREHWDLREQAAGECPLAWAWPVLVDLGRPDLAARTTAWAATRSADQIVRGHVEGWVGELFERAITHYMQREDAVARADLEAIARLRPVAQELGVDPDELGYLDGTDALRAELARRAGLAARASLELAEEGPVPPSMVPALIDALDEVDARQWGQPGGVSLSLDPRVDALIRVGEAAMPALLECLEHDARLTRSVHFWRDFARHRSVLGVHEACYVALASIADEDFFDVAATGDDLSARGAGGRAAVAERFRAYWARWGSVTPVERRWLLLSDDSATPEQWARAAEWLTAGHYGTHESTIEIPPFGPGGDVRMEGEPLRAERGDALLALFLARARSTQAVGAWGETCSLVFASLDWAGDVVPPDAVSIALDCQRSGECRCRDWLAARLGHASEAIAIEWLGGVEDLLETGFDAENRVRVLAGLLDVPAVAQAADRRLRAIRIDAAFAEGLAGNPSNALDRVWELAVRRMPAAIDLLERALASNRRAATLEMYDDDPGPVDPDARLIVLRSRRQIPVVRHRGGFWSIELPEPLAAPVVVRVADLTARTLSRYLHVPFSLGSEQARRDDAIRELRERLERVRDGWDPGAPDPETRRGGVIGTELRE